MWLLVSVFTSQINIFVLFIKLMLLFRYCVGLHLVNVIIILSSLIDDVICFSSNLSLPLTIPHMDDCAITLFWCSSQWMRSIFVLLVTELKYNLYYHQGEYCHLLFLLLRLWANVLKSSTHTYSNVQQRCEHIIHTHIYVDTSAESPLNLTHQRPKEKVLMLMGRRK